MVGLAFGGAERSPEVWTLVLKKAGEENAAFPRNCVSLTAGFGDKPLGSPSSVHHSSVSLFRAGKET